MIKSELNKLVKQHIQRSFDFMKALFLAVIIFASSVSLWAQDQSYGVISELFTTQAVPIDVRILSIDGQLTLIEGSRPRLDNGREPSASLLPPTPLGAASYAGFSLEMIRHDRNATLFDCIPENSLSPSGLTMSSQAVPEPSSFFLVGSALALFACRRRQMLHRQG